jgi:hypothetical protein
VITDEQGRFRWMVDRRGGTDPSRCELFATAPGYVPACAPRLPADRPLRIRLQRAVPFEVHVLDDAGSPIQGAIVRVEPSDATGTWCGHAASETSDVEGKAVLDGLGPDVLALRADHPDYMPLRLRRVDPSQTPLEVRLRRAARVEFVLRTADGSTPRGAMLEWTGERDGVHGRVEIPLTVAPLAGAGDRAPRSGPLRLPADAGRLHLSISAPGFATWSRALDLRPGDPPNTLDVSLAR